MPSRDAVLEAVPDSSLAIVNDPVPPDMLRQRFDAVRRRTLALAEPLSAEDSGAQSMEDASPAKWHLAHTTWFFETFVLEPLERGFAPCDPAFRMLFNSYYDGVGDRYPRARRGLLTRPSLDEVLGYRRTVDARIGALLEAAPDALEPAALAEVAALVELGVQHEQQHQELLLTDVKHLFRCNPTLPAYDARPMPLPAPAAPCRWLGFDGGIVAIGHDGNGFCFDNETPRHRQFVEPFRIASRLVTNREFLAFVEAGGYRDPSCWLSEGWQWVAAQDIRHPLYWLPDEGAPGGWREFTLHGPQPLDPARPALHLSYFEADAYARWVGARLPTEAEWECAAGLAGMEQLDDTAWQWTSSSYAPYPGYAPAAGAIGEYNGKFMVNQYVLRGGSHATSPGHARRTYRNFFPATARWQFAGIRLASSV